MSPEAEALARKARSRRRVDLVVVGLFAVAALVVSRHFNLHERLSMVLLRHEPWNLDELIVALAILPVALAYFSTRRWRETVAFNRVLETSNGELRKAASEIRTLRGIVPICASCKRIRDDEGYWHQVESYVAAHTLAEFSHGLCADCMRKLYPEVEPGGQPHRL